MTSMTIPKDIVGRPCPYCRTDLAEGTEVVECDSCRSFHHADCWRQAHGCATFGCVNAPKEEDSDEDREPSGRSTLRRIGVALAILLGIAVIAGSVFAIITVLSGNSDDSEESTSTTTSTVPVETLPPLKPPAPALDTSDGDAFVRSYFALLNKGRFSRAWDALSGTEQAEAGGYDAWRAGYASTQSTQVLEVSRTGTSGDLTSLEVSIESVSRCGGQQYSQAFSGSWTVNLPAKEITSASFVQTGGDSLPSGC